MSSATPPCGDKTALPCNSAADFHSALCSHSSAYTRYAEVRQELWRDDSFQQKNARLGRASDYADHYVRYLLPLLVQHFSDSTSSPTCASSGDSSILATARNTRRFLDLGCAPGGLCHALLHYWPDQTTWSGVGVTLNPSEGGLPMQVSDPSRLEVRYADVTRRSAFVNTCVRTEDAGLCDFVNLGIVVDHTVRSKRQEQQERTAAPPPQPDESECGLSASSFGEQLYTQLLVGCRALRQDGTGVLMMALKTDFPSLPEVMPTLKRLSLACASLRAIPTMYTCATGKKQFYVVAMGCRPTELLAADLRRIWNLGTLRYLALKKAAIDAKRRSGMLQAERKRGRDDEAPTKLSQLPLLDGVESNGYDALGTVAALYSGSESSAKCLGCDLDAFFDMVRNALENNSTKSNCASIEKNQPS